MPIKKSQIIIQLRNLKSGVSTKKPLIHQKFPIPRQLCREEKEQSLEYTETFSKMTHLISLIMKCAR